MLYESFENKSMELMLNHTGLYVNDKHGAVSLDQWKHVFFHKTCICSCPCKKVLLTFTGLTSQTCSIAKEGIEQILVGSITKLNVSK